MGLQTPVKIQPLTLLQRGVIQRLRDVGYPEFADRVRAAWREGAQCENVSIGDTGDRELRADFEKANAQARELEER